MLNWLLFLYPVIDTAKSKLSPTVILVPTSWYQQHIHLLSRGPVIRVPIKASMPNLWLIIPPNTHYEGISPPWTNLHTPSQPHYAYSSRKPPVTTCSPKVGGQGIEPSVSQ